MSRPDKVFLVLSVLGVCLQPVLTRFDPDEFPHIITPSFLIFLFVALLIILSWWEKRFPLKKGALTEILQILLTFGLIAVGVANKWPSLKGSFSYIIHPPGPLATLYVFVLVVVFAYAYPELRARHPLAYFGIDILIAVAMCYFSTEEYMNTRRPSALAGLAAAAMILSHGVENYRNREPSQRTHLQ